MYNLIFLNRGDAVTIDNINYYYAGIDPVMKYGPLPCVLLARDLNNPNTYNRFSNDYLMQRGYTCMMKIKYKTTIYNRNNPNGKTVIKISTGAPVPPLDTIITSNYKTINLKNDKWRYLIEPGNIIKVYNA